jgi:sugar phosphate isomerase/epimerase
MSWNELHTAMKLGFVTAIVPELSLEQVLTLARDEGFGCIEVMCWPVGKAERKYAGITHIDAIRREHFRARLLSEPARSKS